MSDYIDRQAAIDALGIEPVAFSEYENGLHDKWEDNVEALMKLPSAQPETQWIPCSERMPERIINDDVETVQEFFVTVKERWSGEEWEYHTDVAEFPGDYIDDLWQTYNDWKEGQEVHVIAWIPLPEPYKEENR